MIDCHVHVSSDGRWFDTSVDASIHRLLNELNNFDVEKVVLIPAGKSETELAGQMSFITSLVERYPDKFLGYMAYYHGMDLKQISEGKFVGIKIHPRLHKIDVLGNELIPLYTEASKHGIPITFDAMCIPGYGVSLQDIKPEKYSELANMFPSLKIILAHSGMPFIWDAYALLKGHANVFADLAYILYYFKGSSLLNDLAWVLKKIPHKFIYGSDFPEVSLINYYEEFKTFCKAHHISVQDINDNAQKVI